MVNHVHRIAPMGTRVLINGTWYYSAVLPFLNELFPTRLRGTGVGFIYNAGRAVGGLFPFLVDVVSTHMSLGDAISLFAAISYGIMLVVALVLKETKDMALKSQRPAFWRRERIALTVRQRINVMR
jgi:hypothetical protein